MKGSTLVREDAGSGSGMEVALSELAFEALTAAGPEVDASSRMESAVRCYLEDRESGRPAWSYPSFLRDSETRAEVRVELDAPPDLWRAFEEEAARQGVTVEQLSEHAAFYFAAELDAGRVTQRILDDLGQGEGGELS